MNSPTPDEVTEKPLSAKLDSEVKGLVRQESAKPAETAHTKIGIDAERIRSPIARLTSDSTAELEKLITELEQLQEFLKSETGRVQREIGSRAQASGVAIVVAGADSAIIVTGTNATAAVSNLGLLAKRNDVCRKAPPAENLAIHSRRPDEPAALQPKLTRSLFDTETGCHRFPPHKTMSYMRR